MKTSQGSEDPLKEIEIKQVWVSKNRDDPIQMITISKEKHK